MVDVYPKNWKHIKNNKWKSDDNPVKKGYYLAFDDFKFTRHRCYVNGSINWRCKDVVYYYL